MELVSSLVSGLFGLAVVGAIVWTFVSALIKAALDPVHAKLDRLIALQERPPNAR